MLAVFLGQLMGRRLVFAQRVGYVMGVPAWVYGIDVVIFLSKGPRGTGGWLDWVESKVSASREEPKVEQRLQGDLTGSAADRRHTKDMDKQVGQ